MVKNQNSKNTNKKSSKGAGQQMPSVVRKVTIIGRGGGLDGPAMAHARLLADPCNAPLAHPIYPGGSAGYLVRVDSFATYGATATFKSGIVHWTPGYINNAGTELLVATGVEGSSTMAMAATSDTPGKAFLSTSAAGIRCVAACVKVMYPGSESTRGGRVHFGHTPAGIVDAGESLAPDAMTQALTNYCRTPVDNVEVMWKPSAADCEMNDPNAPADAVIRDRKSAITVAFIGIAQGIGLVFHFTAVYEWMPRAGVGLSGNSLGKSISSNSWDDVLDYLLKRGFKFISSNTGQMLTQALAAGVANSFGQMPSRMRTINSRIAY